MKGFTRPNMTVLSESNAIPEGHLVEPPEKFTHVLDRDEPYWYDQASAPVPDRMLAAGTKVRVLDEDDAMSRVVDSRGLLVTIEKSALRKL